MKNKSFKNAILKTINKSDGSDKLSRNFDIFIMTLIVLNVLAVITETVESIYTVYKVYFTSFEFFSVVVFTIEYFIRIWTCTLNPKYSHPVWGRVKYVLSLEAIIDLLAILPFFLPLLLPLNGLFLRILRMFRLLRIFKLGRYSKAFQMVVRAVSNRKDELLIVLSLVMVLLILSSSLMYYIEHEAQPDVFTSIPATMWWAVATLTTVGYGDVYPITPLGKLLGAFIAILGIGVFALPAGIIASSFESEMSNKEEGEEVKNPNDEK